MDGSIFVNEKITPGSYVDRQVIIHEMRHATDMKVGKLSYADDHIMYNGERFDRETINGLDMITQGREDKSDLKSKLTEMLEELTYSKMLEDEAAAADALQRILKNIPIPNGRAIVMG